MRIIENDVFKNCRGLASIDIPNSVIGIGGYAFYGCTSLTSLTIGSNVSSIDDYAFFSCNNLKTIVSEIEVPFEISATVFNSDEVDIYSTATLIVPKGTKAAYQATEGWNRFANIVEAGEDSPDGIISVKQSYDRIGDFYDLTGRRILHPRKGLYIRNGQKLIVRAGDKKKPLTYTYQRLLCSQSPDPLQGKSVTIGTIGQLFLRMGRNRKQQ